MKIEKIGDLIKGARNNLGISQRELARRIKVDNAAISRIENGEIKKPSYEVLKKLSDELNIELSELLTSARYTLEELESLGIINKGDWCGIKGSDKMENYLIDDDNYMMVDIIKVLKGYKNNKLRLDETFGLLMVRLGIDLTKYVSQEDRKKYGLDNMVIGPKNNE